MAKRRILGAVVGGVTEQKAFVRWFSRKNIALAASFGGTAGIAGMSRDISSMARLLSAKGCSSVIAVLDREHRDMSAALLEKSIQKEVDRELGSGKVLVVFADRMIENWMLADVESCKRKKYIKRQARQRNYESTHGACELRKLFTKAHSYSKTSNGPELLSLIDVAVAELNSNSFSRFANAIK